MGLAPSRSQPVPGWSLLPQSCHPSPFHYHSLPLSPLSFSLAVFLLLSLLLEPRYPISLLSIALPQSIFPSLFQPASALAFSLSPSSLFFISLFYISLLGISHLSVFFKSLPQISPSSLLYFSLSSLPISVSPIFSPYDINSSTSFCFLVYSIN